jgi:hypothetical protein
VLDHSFRYDRSRGVGDDQVKTAIKLEMQEFSERVRSAEAKEACSAFLENVR